MPNLSTTSQRPPFRDLGPDTVLDAVESVGLATDGRLFALNSYENRVYRVGLQDSLFDPTAAVPGIVPDAVVVKFYRPGRWSDAQLREEHDFGAELADADLPVAPALFFDGESLFRHAGFRFAIFACRRGAAPELDAPGARALLGRTLGRVHAVGGRNRFQYREDIAAGQWGERARRTVLESPLLPSELQQRYAQVSADLVGQVRDAFGAQSGLQLLRIHGDCHLGNVLWDDNGPVFVDLDDCLQGPAVQDLWMFLSGGEPDRQRREWGELLDGYEQFAHLDYQQVALIEPLRALRMINYAAWLAGRWNDPAFPMAFPWFTEGRYWERHVQDLLEQSDNLRNPPLLTP